MPSNEIPSTGGATGDALYSYNNAGIRWTRGYLPQKPHFMEELFPVVLSMTTLRSALNIPKSYRLPDAEEYSRYSCGKTEEGGDEPPKTNFISFDSNMDYPQAEIPKEKESNDYSEYTPAVEVVEKPEARVYIYKK